MRHRSFVKEPYVMLAGKKLCRDSRGHTCQQPKSLLQTLLLMRSARVVIVVYFASAGTLLLRYSAPATGTKELAVELTGGSKKSSDSGCGCSVLSMLVMETVIV